MVRDYRTTQDENTHCTMNLNRGCPRALQLHSTLHFSLEALHQWVLRTNILIMNMNTIHWRSYGVGFLDPWCASRLVLALQRSSAHIQRAVDCKLSFIPLVFIAFKQLTIASYTASAYLVPKQHRARVRKLITCQITLFIGSQTGCLVGGLAQYPRCGIPWNQLNVILILK